MKTTIGKLRRIIQLIINETNVDNISQQKFSNINLKRQKDDIDDTLYDDKLISHLRKPVYDKDKEDIIGPVPPTNTNPYTIDSLHSIQDDIPKPTLNPRLK